MDQEHDANTLTCSGFSGKSEEVSCPVCLPDLPPPTLVYRKKNGVSIWQCPTCEIMYASPRFTRQSLLDIYENPAFINQKDFSMFSDWSYEKWKISGHESFVTSQLKVDLIRRYLDKEDRVLDVGCSMGFFCREATEQGYRVEGMEPSRMLADLARERIKAPVIHNTLIENFSPGYRYRGIVLWDVLEHVYDPVDMIRRCAGLTDDGGFLFLQVPNFEGISDRWKTFLCRKGLKKCDFKHFGFPWHIFSFNRASLSRLLQKCGYEPLFFESWSHTVKKGGTNPLSQVAASFVRARCLSDYITCVARKE